MAIILVPQPGSTPSDLTDWTKSVESLKQYNLGVNQPVAYDFTGNTIKKGVLITIGGSNYYCNANTAISGTPSDYVKITSTGVASYVSSLSGVSWNDTYNFYADSSGNAYIFNEAKAGLANTVIGKFAEHGYFTEMEVMGIATFGSDTINMYKHLAINTNLSDWGLAAVNTSATGHGAIIRGGNASTSVILECQDYAGTSRFKILGNGSSFFGYNGGKFIINSLIDDGSSQLQVTGLATFVGKTVTTSTAADWNLIVANTSVSGKGMLLRGGAGASLSILECQDYAGTTKLDLKGDGTLNLPGTINPTRTTTIGAGVTITSAGSASFSGAISAGSASFSGAINPTRTTTIGAGVTITSAGSASFSGAINPTSTPGESTTPTLTTNGATYTIPRGIYNIYGIITTTLSTFSYIDLYRFIDGAWRLSDFVSASEGTSQRMFHGTYFSTGDNLRIQLRAESGASSCYAVLSKT